MPSPVTLPSAEAFAVVLNYLKRLLVISGAVVFATVGHSLVPHTWLTNPEGSVQTLSGEGVYPTTGLPFRRIVLDNYTDALMLNTAYATDPADPIRSAFLNPRYHSVAVSDQIDAFRRLTEDDDGGRVYYERYWHGYLLFLKPLLMITTYDGVRIVLTVLLATLSGIVLFLAWKQGLWRLAIATGMGLAAVDIGYIGKSIQFSSVFLIGLISGIIFLQRRRSVNGYLLAMTVGGVTAFFDLLTAPLVTLGCILLIDFAVNRRSALRTLCLCFAWASGYLGIWSVKWVVVELMFSPGALRTAYEQIATRTVMPVDSSFSHLEVIRRNVMQLIGYDRFSKLIAGGIAVTAGAVGLRYIRITKQNRFRLLAPAIAAVLPYCWYLIAANHSYLHVWFTYRAQFITVAVLVYTFLEHLNYSAIKHDLTGLSTLVFRRTSRHVQGEGFEPSQP